MGKVYVGFSYHKKNLLSRIIKAVQGSAYSHVYIRRESKYGPLIYQASGLAVNFMNAETFFACNVAVEEYEFDLRDDQHDKMMKFMVKYAGRPYDLKALFKILAITAARKIGWKLHFDSNKDSMFICSELGDLFCEEILDIDIPGDADFVTPLDLNPYVAKAGKKVI